MNFIISLLASFLVFTCVSGSPVAKRTKDDLLLRLTTKSPECNVDGEVESADICKPFCVCSNGKLICAEITCTDDFDMSDTKAKCEKVHVSGRCCHNYLCIHEDGTGTMVYPLPIVSAPDELYAR